MAQLKLMKKEWFDWFKGTTLENVTAWTEYYYINPDSQHWISNYQLWDEEWELARLNENTGEFLVGNYVCSKNFIECLPNETYFIKIPTSVWFAFYDINHTFISASSYNANSTFTTPNDAYYMKIQCFASYGTTYNHDICINRSNPTFNGQYEPRIINIEDILEVVDLGSLDYERTQSGLFMSRGLILKVKWPSSSAVALKTIYCPIYNVITSNDITGPLSPNPSPDMVMAINFEGVLYVNNFSYTDINEFKQAMTGVYVIFVKRYSPLG